jgi:protein ImuB
LPLPALRLDADTVAWLNKLGINCIGDVLNQPRATLPSRFGPQLLERLDQALGSAPELMPLLWPAPEFHATVAFEYLLKDLQWLQPVIEKLVAQVSAEMQQHCRGAREIECWLYQEMGEPLCAAVSLHKASASAQHLLQLLNTQLEGMQSRIQNSKCKMQNDERPAPVAQRKSQNENLHPEDGICAVALRVMATEPLDDEQLALFHQAVKTPESLALTLDRLSTRLGREAVVRARLVDDPQPEDAVAWVGVGEGEAEGGRQTAESRRRKAEGRGQTTENGDAERPLLMLAQPEPIAVMWPRHSLWPLRFEWRGKPQLVREASGPERIETGWWKAAYTRRDYYVVETKAGGRYWIFKRLDDEQWFVQGVFG